ncbi:MAG: hypothetical protein FWD53_05425 [Phycisphaerales bacterium]|nr:hypothetical protein [Phycisphaerales bacterium]
MNKLPLLAILCYFTVTGCLETRVIHDNSVTKQFMELDGRGNARVTIGDGSAQAKQREQARALAAKSRQNTYHNPNWNPLGKATFRTNFKVDETDPNAAMVAPSTPTPPPSMIPLMGGLMLPAAPTTQPVK